MSDLAAQMKEAGRKYQGPAAKNIDLVSFVAKRWEGA